MKSLRHIVIACALAAASVATAESTSTAPAEKSASLSPAVERAIRDLSADEFSVREKAVDNLQLALAQQLRAILAAEDPEAQQRLVGLLEYQDGICRWAIEVLKLPQDQRSKLLTWGLKPENTGSIAKIYSATTPRRVEGVKALAASKDEEASWLLGNLLNDDTREVYLAAMEAVWDRKPTDAIVDALWNRAVEAGISMYRPRVFGGGAQQAVFRGRVIGGMAAANPYRRAQDSDPATETLIQLKAPQVPGKVKAFLAGIEKDLEKNEGQMQFVFMPYNEPTRNLYRILEAYKVDEAIPFLLKQAEGKVTSRQQMNVNNKPAFSSNRTAPLVALIRMTGQNPEDYKFTKSANMGYGIGWAAASEKDETAAVEKFKKWMGDRKAGKTPEAAATSPATTGKADEKPAEVPADAAGNKDGPPAQIKLNINGVMIHGGGAIQINGGGVIRVEGGKVEMQHDPVKLEAQDIIINGQ